jgi:hypothetical protein
MIFAGVTVSIVDLGNRDFLDPSKQDCNSRLYSAKEYGLDSGYRDYLSLTAINKIRPTIINAKRIAREDSSNTNVKVSRK